MLGPIKRSQTFCAELIYVKPIIVIDKPSIKYIVLASNVFQARRQSILELHSRRHDLGISIIATCTRVRSKASQLTSSNTLGCIPDSDTIDMPIRQRAKFHELLIYASLFVSVVALITANRGRSDCSPESKTEHGLNAAEDPVEVHFPLPSNEIPEHDNKDKVSQLKCLLLI
jgi:hypothetical protein